MKNILIIPLLNEEGNISLLIDKILKARDKRPFEIILINDGSSDSTGQIIDRLAKKYGFISSIHHPVNMGWGAVLKNGIKEAVDRKADVIMWIDGDLTHDPKYIPQFIDKIEEGADIVVGSRFIRGGGMVNVPKDRVFLSTISNFFFRHVLGIKTRDLTSGFRAHRAKTFEKIHIEEDTFMVNLELIIKASKMGFKVVEIPIFTYPRKEGSSSRTNFPKEIARYLSFILKNR